MSQVYNRQSVSNYRNLSKDVSHQVDESGSHADRAAVEMTQSERLAGFRRSPYTATQSDSIPQVPETIPGSVTSIVPEGGDMGEVLFDSFAWGTGAAGTAYFSGTGPVGAGVAFGFGFGSNFVSSMDLETDNGPHPNNLVNTTSEFDPESNSTTSTQFFEDGTYVHTTSNHTTGSTVTQHQDPSGSITTTVSTPDVAATNSPTTNVTTTPSGQQITSVTSPTGGTYTASNANTTATNNSSNSTTSGSDDSYTPQATQPTQNDDGTVTSPTGGTYGPSTPSTDSGGSSSSGGEGRVICTHFYKKGMLSREVWRADLEFTAKHLSETTVRGYQYWAIPYVKLMRRSVLAENIMFPLAEHRANELAYQLGRRECGSLRGKLIRTLLEPVCFIIGSFVEQKDWSQLWLNVGTEFGYRSRVSR